MSFHDLKNFEKKLNTTNGASKGQINEYVRNVTQFYSQVETWLTTKMSNKEVTLKRVPVDLKESNGTDYQVDSLEIQTKKLTIFLHPKGLHAQAVKHHQGVVTMGGAGTLTYKFILVSDGLWEYEGNGAQYEPLTQTQFMTLYESLIK